MIIDLDVNRYKVWIKIFLFITIPIWIIPFVLKLIFTIIWEFISEYVDKNIPDYIHLNKMQDILELYKRRRILK